MSSTVRALVLVLGGLLPLLAAEAAEAQGSFGAYAVRATESFDGANGVGVQAAVSFPVLPLEAFVAGDRFSPDCDGCSMWGGSIGVNVTVLPLGLASGYVTGGLVRRRVDLGEELDSVTDDAFNLGVGMRAGLGGLNAFLEGRYEFFDDGEVVLRLGLMF